VRLTWVTDPHLNFVGLAAREAWLAAIRETSPDCLLITGDIAEAESLAWELERLGDELPIPIYFVLGNHDFYGGSIEQVRAGCEGLRYGRQQLLYVGAVGPQLLSDGWVVVGQDGWGDAGDGDPLGSIVRLNDFHRIVDFQGLSAVQRVIKLQQLGRQAADRLELQLERGAQLGDALLVITHVPPVRSACLYRGQPADDHWAPFFVGHQVGELLRRFAREHPEHRIVVLCGHSHHVAKCQPESNLWVLTGGAEYGFPTVAGSWDSRELADAL
jgi:3',5'-cyclic-AMP phosphodiesterase